MNHCIGGYVGLLLAAARHEQCMRRLEEWCVKNWIGSSVMPPSARGRHCLSLTSL